MARAGVGYAEIAADLRKLIVESKAVPPGGQLPPEADLAARYGCQRMTVQRAYNELIREGLVEAVGRQGYFVSLPRVQVWDMTRPEPVLERGGVCVGTEVRIFPGSLPAASTTLARLTGTQPGDRWLCRQALYAAGATSLAHVRTLAPYPSASATDLADPSREEVSFLAVLRKQGWSAADGWQDLTGAHMATPDERETLKLTGVLALVEHVRLMPFTGPGGQRLTLVRHALHVAGTGLQLRSGSPLHP